ncbi:uncharacterized protein C8A04DRAFT_13771 [Dichotomopilus funicola]|uniref:Protein HRI1 n=1 Tax=Dichotomopilus funicola TaxID=1934379 RepID=A0AAN6ZLK4_9PEZI|nr:hypothetical protein C8A04DRAFT_13771 [Dichotomopilus funicola]
MDISIRESIRWFPDAASEPTSTIVLTTPARRFVDLRILKGTEANGADIGNAGVVSDLNRLDWAIAGTSSVDPPHTTDNSTNPIQHGRWAHWIDSRLAECDGVVDEGDMVTDPANPALTIETGRMVNPATGAVTAYEEIWRSEGILDVPAGGGGGAFKLGITCIALRMDSTPHQSNGPIKRGLVVRLGQYCQAFARDGDALAVERVVWNAETQRWVTTVRMGDPRLEMPTEVATYLAHVTAVGDEVRVGGVGWRVVERV